MSVGRLLAGALLVAFGVSHAARACDQAAAEAVLARGVAAYEARSYGEAEAAFREVVSSGCASASAFLNLGNAAYRQGRWPLAILGYEAAAELAPADQEIHANLALARRHVVTDVVGRQLAPETRRIVDFVRGLPLEATLPAFVALWLLGWGLIAARVARGTGGLAGAGTALVLLSLVAGAHVAWSLDHARGPARAVLQEPEVAVRSGPGPDYTTLFALHAGCLVEVEERRDQWSRIRVPQGPAGWVPTRGVALLFDPSTWP